MYKGKKVSLILPTYNEKDSIKKVILDFEQLNIVDEIIVINNNAAAGTSEEVALTNAIEIIETKQGYGSAIRRGFKEATGDLIVVCEPDDTFLPNDIFKLLVYVDDVSIVYGSRTSKQFIWKGANMGWFLKWGNWATAKIIELLFNTNSLTDVGCTYRIIRREALEKLEKHFTVNSNFFGPEMMILGFRYKIPSVQIPINYKERVGESSVTGNLAKAFVLGIKMNILIVAMKLKIEKNIIKIMERL
jgi:glycosyltransferase involved in cell wall biosynthesis